MLWRYSTYLTRMGHWAQLGGRREEGGGRAGGRGGERDHPQPVLTRSIFIVVAEVQANGSAELQHIAPLVFVYHFIF